MQWLWKNLTVNEPDLGNYGIRDCTVHRLDEIPYRTNNRYIRKWLTDAHDTLLTEQIDKKRWIWYVNIYDDIASMTAPDQLDRWKREDPTLIARER